MAYLYSVGYAGYEDSWHYRAWHDRAWSQDELRAVVEECIWGAMQADREYMRQLGCEEGWSPFLSSLMSSRPFMAAMAERGFREVEYAGSMTLWGGVEVTDPDDQPPGPPCADTDPVLAGLRARLASEQLSTDSQLELT